MPIFGGRPKTFVDEAQGDAEAGRLRAAAAAKDWRQVETALLATTDPLRREFLIDRIVDDTKDLGWVESWVNEKPADETARLMWGRCAIQYAWNIRSGRAPQHVSKEQFQGFFEWLGHAEEQLGNAASMDPRDPEPYVGLLWSGVGLQVDREEEAARWELAVERNPRTQVGLWAYTTHISPKWHGSAELMWGFLRDFLSREPEGSPRWVMVPMAHFEEAVEAGMHGNTSVRGTGHFEKPDVQRDITDAYAKSLASAAKQPSPFEWSNRQFFAVAFYLMGARELLRKEMQGIGPGIQSHPWAYLGNSIGIYEKAREWAGLR
ncbi:MAG TPA: hypothetical protein VFL27_14295 [Candidatus Dormibacteraeota bacterium]|nr:hypothetical protein [Candidatus Dormibacteraeota bacterium]